MAEPLGVLVEIWRNLIPTIEMDGRSFCATVAKRIGLSWPGAECPPLVPGLLTVSGSAFPHDEISSATIEATVSYWLFTAYNNAVGAAVPGELREALAPSLFEALFDGATAVPELWSAHFVADHPLAQNDVVSAMAVWLHQGHADLGALERVRSEFQALESEYLGRLRVVGHLALAGESITPWPPGDAPPVPPLSGSG